MDNAEFSKLGEQFVLVFIDSRNGRSEVAKRFELNRNRAQFVILHPSGVEIGRLSREQSKTFRADQINLIREIGNRYVPMRSPDEIK